MRAPRYFSDFSATPTLAFAQRSIEKPAGVRIVFVMLRTLSPPRRRVWDALAGDPPAGAAKFGGHWPPLDRFPKSMRRRKASSFVQEE